MVYGRENAGQLFEISLSYICIQLVDFFRTYPCRVDECIDVFLRLLNIVSPSMCDEYEKMFSVMSDDDIIIYIQSILDDDAIYLAIEPMSENMTIEKLEKIYEEFPWIEKGQNILMPITDSENNIRYVKSRRPITYGYLYFYRLKQYAEEKFSVTSLSSTNIKNENTRNKASNNYKALYSRTPIRFGEMEFGNFNHMGADLVSQILMIYSSSPLARQLCSELETGDPFNVDVKLDMDSKNRNAEILNVYLKTKGLKLTFIKHLKKKKQPILKSPMYFTPVEEDKSPMIFYDHGQRFNIDDAIDQLRKTRDTINPMDIFPMEFFDEIHVEDNDNGVEG